MKSPHINNKEQGSVLFVSLIILLIITVVAIGSTRVSTAGQRISFNYQMKNSTFQAADSALAEAKERLVSSPVNGSFSFPAAFDNPWGDANRPSLPVEVSIRRLRIADGGSLSVTAPKTYAYKIISCSEVLSCSAGTSDCIPVCKPSSDFPSELEEGFLKPDVGGN